MLILRPGRTITLKMEKLPIIRTNSKGAVIRNENYRR